MDANDLPNLLIIGAPKCGTTSVFRWLAEHPQVCASIRKETWFFADDELDYLDVRPNHRRDDVHRYLDCFGAVRETTKIKFEGSSHYLYSDQARNFFSARDPQPRLIVLMRDPAVRIWSHFNYIRQRANRPIALNFADYVDQLISTAKPGHPAFTEEKWPQFLLQNQLAYSDYEHHLSKWLDHFPRENLFVLTLEELQRRKGDVACAIAEWAGIDTSFYDDYPFATANAKRSRNAEAVRRRLARVAHYFPDSIVQSLKWHLDSLLAAPGPARDASDELAIARLRDHFTDANNRLQQVLNIDLSHWTNTR